MKRFYFLFTIFILSSFFSGAVMADDEKERQLGQVVVTATKSEVSLKETGSSVTVITSDEIEKKGKKQVIDLLQEVPGLSVSRTGFFGGAASIFVRGNNSENVLVLVDGVRINDPISTGRGADLAFMTTDNVERIEIVRTPQGALYGSDAQAVINIITKKGEGRPVVSVSAEAGSFYTFRESASISGGSDGISYSVGISRQDSKGISSAENKSKGSTSSIKNSDYEKDRFANTAITSRLGIDLPLGINYTLSGYYQSAKYDYDDGAEIDDLNKMGENEIFTFNNVLTQDIFSWWNHKLEYGRTSTTRRDQDNNDRFQPVNDEEHSWYKGVSNQAEWQHNFKIGEIDTITAGYNFYHEEGSSLYYSNLYGDFTSNSYIQNATTHSIYLHNHLKLFDMIYHTAGIRYDHHSEFGNKFTWNTTASVIAPVTETRIKGAYGTSFKAPSLYQLYDSYSGSRDLKPGKGNHVEAGIEQPLLGNIALLSATYFYNKYENMIDWVKTYPDPYNFEGKYFNTDRIETQGCELYALINLPFDLSLSGSYTYTKTEDKKTYKELARRPKHQLSAILNWSILKKADLNIVYNYVGKRYDDTDNNTKMDSYSTVDLKLSYWVTPNIQVYGRIENMINEDYQQVNGYAMPGVAFYGGIQGQFL